MITLPASALASRVSYWQPSVACKPRLTVAMWIPELEETKPVKETTIIHLNINTKMAVVTVNGDVIFNRKLTGRDPVTLARFYRDGCGFKISWLNGDVCLLTKKITRSQIAGKQKAA